MELSESASGALNPELNRGQFEKIASLLYSSAKINMQTGKEQLVKARLVKRMRLLGISGFEEYIEKVESDPAELYQMVDLLTTNKTSFFREQHHFDFLRSRFLHAFGGGRLRIWSAGCSSGEEPYSIAITLREELGDLACADARVLATDISKRVLFKAEEGAYTEDTLSEVPAFLVDKYFTASRGPHPCRYFVKPVLRDMVRFAPLNLMGEWPMNGPFDVVFCRNVMIYFDKPTQQELVRRFWGILKPGGYLFVGHSESLTGMMHGFRYVQPAVYQKE